jgi:hypothetical protein
MCSRRRKTQKVIWKSSLLINPTHTDLSKKGIESLVFLSISKLSLQ